MYFASLVRRSTLASELVNVEGNAKAQANLDVVEAKRNTLMEELDRVCDLMTDIDNDLASAQEELLRVQAWITILAIAREAKATEGSAIELRISINSSNIGHLHEEFARQGDQIQSSLTI